MITEDYVSLETAKLLKEKGFNEPCFAYYSEYIYNWRTRKLWKKYPKIYDTVKNDGYILVPTLQMAMKWLREIKNIFISIDYSYICSQYKYSICLADFSLNHKNGANVDYDFKTYEEACEAAVKYCLTNLI